MNIEKAKKVLTKTINQQKTKEDLLKCLKFSYCFIELNLIEVKKNEL